jgi:hypothetical protein|tara:strand:- start:54 stop:587 length:534 start_codon:yes stop_codon:yes gene_type:complete
MKETKCYNCGNRIFRKERLFAIRKRFFCNQPCKWEWQKENLKGENNPFYAKVVTDEHRNKISQSRKQGFKEGRIVDWKVGLQKDDARLINLGKQISKSRWKYGSKTYYKTQARNVLNKYLGYKLGSDKIIHHIDINPKNNDVNNLYVFNSNSEHIKYHVFLRNIVKEYLMIDKGIKL